MTAHVYAIVNLNDGYGTGYIGSTVNPEKRWRQHKSDLNCGRHHCAFLQRSWDKYGKDSFTLHILEVISDVVALRNREQYWLDAWHNSGRVFNTGKNTSAPMEGRTHTPEARERIRQANLGRKHTPEARRRISEATRNRTYGPQSPESVAKRADAIRGTKWSEEARLRLSEVSKQRCATEKGRMQLLQAGRANVRSYPALIHDITGDTIPAGKNLSDTCKRRGLNYKCLWRVVNGQRKSHKGWRLLDIRES